MPSLVLFCLWMISQFGSGHTSPVWHTPWTAMASIGEFIGLATPVLTPITPGKLATRP